MGPRLISGLWPRLPLRSPSPPPPPPVKFEITDIPGIMDKKGWPRGARLMRRWFGLPARTMSDAEKRGVTDPRTLSAEAVDDVIMTMDSILGFRRVKAVYDDLFGNYANVAAKGEMLRKLDKWVAEKKITGAAPFRFGDLGQPTKVIDATCQTNVRPVGDTSDDYDGFYAAIGRGTLKVAVSATVQRTGPGRYDVLSLDEVGIYLRDTYDFNGDQPLGYWNDNGVSSYNIFTGNYVNNESFRDWRDAHQRGGDFVIFSDVKRTKVPPFAFKLPV